MAHWESSKETRGWELDIPTIGVGNGGSMLTGDQEIHHEEAEHSLTAYCDANSSGPL